MYTYTLQRTIATREKRATTTFIDSFMMISAMKGARTVNNLDSEFHYRSP